jgi:hypothetical protein
MDYSSPTDKRVRNLSRFGGAGQLAAIHIQFSGAVLFNSNAEAAHNGGTTPTEIGPLAGLSWSAPLLNLPVRISGNLRAEFDRFMESNSAEVDNLNGSLRFQYIDPNQR